MPTKLTQINLDGTLYDIGAEDSAGFGGVEMIGIELASTGWSNGLQIVTVSSNAIATSDYLAIPQLETAESYGEAGIVLTDAIPNPSAQTLELHFSCTSTPTTNVNVVVLVSTSVMQTQIDLAEAIGNFPKIQNGVWYTYNPNTQTWVNSGVKAGITSITQTTTSSADGGSNIITAVLSDNTTTTFTIKNGSKGSQGEKGETGDSATYYFLNKSASSWVSDNTYADFPYTCTVSCQGVTANDGVSVTFAVPDAVSGNYAPVANTVANGVQIWSKLNTSIIIPTIAITPPAEGSITTPSANWLDQAYPIGSVYISSTNANPTSTLGGTWTLIDKEFSVLSIGSNNYSSYFTADAATTVTNCGIYRVGHSIALIRITFTNTNALADSTINIGTFNMNALGIDGLPYAVYATAQSDGGNGISMMQITTAGVLQSIDVVTKTSGGSIAASSSIGLSNTIITLNTSHMLDSACDKFYWKRTA